MKQDISAARLRELLNYDAETGLFTQKLARGKSTVGCVVGYRRKQGYVMIKLDYMLFYAHRLAWLYAHGQWPQLHIDHLNGIKHDNRISNLRDVTPLINSQNKRKATARSLSGLLGTIKHRNKWDASITIDGAITKLGRFNTAQEAHEAYVIAKRKFHIGGTI